MIARHETPLDKHDIWSALSAPLPPGVISWRQDGRPVSRDGRHIARFVAYIEANTVRERLDSVVPGEWDLTLELLPPVAGLDEDANQGACSFKARLQILGVIREDVGTGKDYKQAATDAFKRAAVRFGIAHELYAYEQNWVQMDGDGKYAKPVEDPAVAYARRYGKTKPAVVKPVRAAKTARTEQVADLSLASDAVAPADTAPAPVAASGPLALDEQSCPKCGGRMWDNRLTKRNPKAPDFKCRDRSCDGVIWPPKGEKAEPAKAEKHAEETEEIPF
ncbi:MAG TPA: Rad52/Rad22 family DNA repair protein [Gemmatimonadaceae bacterium]|nr:Rad52/Rad22 family DNA repair protein [Gemmatimonadaceae bacterium]